MVLYLHFISAICTAGFPESCFGHCSHHVSKYFQASLPIFATIFYCQGLVRMRIYLSMSMLCRNHTSKCWISVRVIAGREGRSSGATTEHTRHSPIANLIYVSLRSISNVNLMGWGLELDMRNCGEPQLPGLGSWRGSTWWQQGKRKKFPFNPGYGHVYSAMLFSFEALQSSKGAGNGWNRNEMLGQHSYTASSSSTARDKIGTATEQRNSPFGTSAQNKTQKAPRSKAASRALCNRNFEMETGCLMNCKMLSLMRGDPQCSAALSQLLLPSSSMPQMWESWQNK